MARTARQAVAGYPCHVIQRGNNRQPVFVDDLDRREYLASIAEAIQAHAVTLHAYVLMDNHVHLLVTPRAPEGLSRALQALGRRYVRRFNRRHGRTGTLWEGRFRSSLIETDRYLLACQRYIELNPVRAGLVVSAADWPWSSHRHHAGLAHDPLVTAHPVVWSLGNTPFERETQYRHLFEEALSGAETDWITRRSLQGKPIASDHFLQNMHQSMGIKVLSRPVGRPPKRIEPSS